MNTKTELHRMIHDNEVWVCDGCSHQPCLEFGKELLFGNKYCREQDGNPDWHKLEDEPIKYQSSKTNQREVGDNA